MFTTSREKADNTILKGKRKVEGEAWQAGFHILPMAGWVLRVAVGFEDRTRRGSPGVGVAPVCFKLSPLGRMSKIGCRWWGVLAFVSDDSLYLSLRQRQEPQTGCGNPESRCAVNMERVHFFPQ